MSSLILKLRLWLGLRRLVAQGRSAVDLSHDRLGVVPMPWAVLAGGRRYPFADVMAARQFALVLRSACSRPARVTRNRSGGAL